MAKQTFTTGQVLTAAQMTALQANDYNWTVSAKVASYVLVAADAGTRITMNAAGATTITVNTALFTAGDVLDIVNIGAGTCTITAGTATVTTAGSLALTQWSAGSLYFTSASAAIFFPSGKTGGSGLTLITSQVIGSAVASVTVSSAFSTTYDSYKIVIAGGAGSSANAGIRMTLGATATGYYYGIPLAIYSGGGAASLAGTNTTSWEVGSVNVASLNLSLELVDPFNTKTTKMFASIAKDTSGGAGGGFLDNTTSYTAFTLTPSAGTLTGGTIYVYGYAKA